MTVIETRYEPALRGGSTFEVSPSNRAGPLNHPRTETIKLIGSSHYISRGMSQSSLMYGDRRACMQDLKALFWLRELMFSTGAF